MFKSIDGGRHWADVAHNHSNLLNYPTEERAPKGNGTSVGPDPVVRTLVSRS
jgi:hypothetical protein